VLLVVVSFDAPPICAFGLENEWGCICRFKI
jgi:hypothetical protein